MIAFLEVLWAFAPLRRLLGVVLILATVAGLIGLREHRLKHSYFDKGYALARDSAREASILREIAVRDSAAVAAVKAARDSSSALVAIRQRFDTATRYTPRIRSLSSLANTPRPLVPDSDLVSVLVESTGEQFILPRRAAEYWHTSDSLVSSAQILLQKYADANRAWSQAWSAEHEARAASDSLVALLQSRVAPPMPKASWKRKALTSAALLTLGAVLHNNIRIR